MSVCTIAKQLFLGAKQSFDARGTAAGNMGQFGNGSLGRRVRLLLVLLPLACLFLFPAITLAQGGEDTDKSGVSPQVISLPSGPGSIEGIGESFEPDLSTGTASYPYKFQVAPGVAGFEPQLSLSYNGGNANGPWGLGWKLSVPSIQRQTDEGLPSYDDGADRFIYSSGEKLVPLSDGDYRFENEGEFMRFRRLSGGGWEAHAPDGTHYIFGETPNARVTNTYGIFRWQLERQTDTHGNEIHYLYEHDGGYAYLSEVRYNFGSDGRYNAVVFRYEPRNDVFTDRSSRAPVSTAWRCTGVEVWALGQFVRAYRFGYVVERSTGTHALLETITQVGADGIQELPPFTFTYTQFDPAAHAVVSMQNPPPLSLFNPDADLVDINYDGLPDVVYTPADGHRFYINRGDGRWQATPEYPAQSPADRLFSPSTMMADMDGNGQADLLVKAGSGSGAPFYVYAGQPGCAWEQGDRIDYNLSPNFGLDDPNVRMFDANNDKRVDIMLTTESQYYVWFAHEDNTWSTTADIAVPALAVGTPLVFGNPRTKLGDMTGDGLQDMVFVRDGLIVYYPYSGNGDYGDGIMMRDGPLGIGEWDTQIQLGDLNNDGLDDLVLVGNNSVQTWLNRGDDSFAPVTVITGTPHYGQTDTSIRLADIDADGASELLYSRYPAPADEIMQYVDFYIGTQPLLLESIDNGLGRTINVEYQPSTTFYVADWDAGMPWMTTLPFPVHVVSRVTVHDANSGDDYVIDYAYHDGYYDGEQKEFRGFGRVEKIEHGDETADTTITSYVYDTGVMNESRKGLVLEMAVLGEGGQCDAPLQECYRREVNQLSTRVLYNGGEDLRISYSFITQTDTYVHENLVTPVQLRKTFDQDDYGNVTREFNYGQVCNGDVTCGDDEILKYVQYAQNLDAWILSKPSLEWQTDAGGNFVSEARFYYDGPDYIGLSLGYVLRGDLSRKEESLGALGDNRFIPTQRQAFDAYGNVVGIMDANGNLTTVEYDPLVHTFPVVERLHLGGDRSLSMVASYHLGFGKIMAATDFGGHAHTYAYDAFGRISRIALPGDTLALPTQQFTFTMGSPRSSIVTAQRERSGEADVRLSVTYFDGLGRKLQTRGEAEADSKVGSQFVVEQALTFNARQSEGEKFLPYFDTTFDYEPPAPTLPHTTLHYDPAGRVVRSVNPDGTFTTVTHRPLAQIQADEEDNTPGSLYFDTPKTLYYDGLERLVGVQEVNVVDGQLEVYNTAYSYDPLGNLTHIVDAQNNVKTMQYNALSRKVYMEDPDRGEMTYIYDDVGNLLQTTDAKGQVISTTYDAANRPLAEQWILTDSTVTTAAVYHYDADLSPRHSDAGNTLGQVAYIEDQAGAVYFSYNERGNVAGQIRYFASPFLLEGGRAGDGGLDFVTLMDYDATDRLVQLTYPDGMTVTYDYNAQGLLERIPGYVDDVDYVASGQRASITYANGVTTTYDYDERLRLRHLQSTDGQAALQDMAYAFDGVSNIVSITDNRPDRTDDNDQTLDFSYDALYRLTGAVGTYGRIDYAYNSIGNMTSKTSTAADSRLNLGEMRYGENDAGPHALTFADGETYIYDANGNLAIKGDTIYTWDYRDRLLAVADGVLASAHVYDAEGQRVRKTVSQSGTVTTTLYLGQYAEVRGDQLVQYIFADEGRTAEVSAPFDTTRLIRGFGGEITSVFLPQIEKAWYLADHLGGTNFLLDENGQATSEVAYYPYGLTRYDSNANGVLYRFTGKELDETNLYYYEARYYAPKVGLFLSVDPLYVENQKVKLEKPSILQLYAYVDNNPIKLIDPTGKQSLPSSAMGAEGAGNLADSTEIAHKKESIESATSSAVDFVKQSANEAASNVTYSQVFGALGNAIDDPKNTLEGLNHARKAIVAYHTRDIETTLNETKATIQSAIDSVVFRHENKVSLNNPGILRQIPFSNVFGLIKQYRTRDSEPRPNIQRP
ncbi:MAG: hypothetical protein GY832_31825 [Chloroflexi bacterium]|nr:hypothetical protein [Chloroflexota bacterium]